MAARSPLIKTCNVNNYSTYIPSHHKQQTEPNQKYLVLTFPVLYILIMLTIYQVNHVNCVNYINYVSNVTVGL